MLYALTFFPYFFFFLIRAFFCSFSFSKDRFLFSLELLLFFLWLRPRNSASSRPRPLFGAPHFFFCLDFSTPCVFVHVHEWWRTHSSTLRISTSFLFCIFVFLSLVSFFFFTFVSNISGLKRVVMIISLFEKREKRKTKRENKKEWGRK